MEESLEKDSYDMNATKMLEDVSSEITYVPSQESSTVYVLKLL
jgi:hypothetical protein